MVPRHGRIYEVAEVLQIVLGVFRPLGEVVVTELLVYEVELNIRERLGVADLQEALVAIPAALRNAGGVARHNLRAVAAEKRSLVVVVAELAHRLNQVLLPVLQAVAIPVKIGSAKDGAGGGVGDRAVHTHEYMVEFCAGEDIRRYIVCNESSLYVLAHTLVYLAAACSEDRHAFRIRNRRAIEEHACELTLPRVGQTIAVGIDRAGVVTAAANRGRAVVSRRPVNGEVIYQHAGIVRLRNTVDNKCILPVLTLSAVFYRVAVGIALARIGREELVVPVLHRARILTRMIFVYRLAFRVNAARICTGEFIDKGKPVGLVNVSYAVVCAFVVTGECQTRIDANVELPSVRHAVRVGIGAVLSHVMLDFPFFGLRSRLVRNTRIGRGPGFDVAIDNLEVLRQSVFVLGRVSDRVLRGAAGNNATRIVLPARRLGEAVSAGVPARAGVEAERTVHLMME